MSKHPWYGNVRELQNTLQRLVLWAPESTISKRDVEDALLPVPDSGTENVMDQKLDETFDLQDLLADIARSYIRKALEESHGNKTEASRLLGLTSYQTLTNWMRKYGLEG